MFTLGRPPKTGGKSGAALYIIRVYLREISPVIWRRVQLRSDQTLTDLHYVLQIMVVVRW